MAVHCLRCTFWSEDYVTGIASLLYSISNGAVKLKETLKLIKDFDDEASTPAIQSLTKLVASNSVRAEDESPWARQQRQQVQLLSKILEKLQLVDHSKLEVDCLAPLEAFLFEYEEFYQESNDLLNSNYGCFSKSLSQAKRSQNEYTMKSENIKQLFLLPTDNNSDDEKEDNISSSTSNNMQFPFVLDERLTFQSETEFEKFVTQIKETTITSRRLIPLPGVPNDYFSCEALFEAIKRILPRLDTSVFNMERIGQALIDCKVISLYNDVLGVKPVFNSQGYYIWVQMLPEKVDNSTEVANHTKDMFTGFFRKISGADHTEPVITSPTRLVEEQRLLEQLKKSSFEQIQALDYVRLHLELELQKCMIQYETMLIRMFQLVSQVSRKFTSLCNSAMSLSSDVHTVDAGQEVERMYEANHGTIGYYVPQPGVTFSQYDSKGFLEAESMFHVDLPNLPTIDKGAACVLVAILENIRRFDGGEVAQALGCPLDLVRVANLRRECMREFYTHRGDHTISINTALRSKQHPVADVVGLLKTWLLELPDSIIPMVCYEDLSIQETTSVLSRAPKEHLANLLEICNCFQWLVKECGTERIANLFFSPQDIPLYHLLPAADFTNLATLL